MNSQHRLTAEGVTYSTEDLEVIGVTHLAEGIEGWEYVEGHLGLTPHTKETIVWIYQKVVLR